MILVDFGFVTFFFFKADFFFVLQGHFSCILAFFSFFQRFVNTQWQEI